MTPRKSAIKTDLFAADLHHQKRDQLGDPLLRIGSCFDFSALAAQVDGAAPRPVSTQGGRPPYPTEVMVRILVLKRLYNLSDEQMEYQLLDLHSYQRFCGLLDAACLPDRTTIWHFENRIGVVDAEALFAAVEQQILQYGYMARGGQIIDATLVPAPKQHFSREDKEQIKEKAMPADWSPAKRRQKDLEANWTKKHGKSTHGFKLSISVDRKHKLIRKWVTDTASVHDSQHIEAVLDDWNTSAEVYKGSRNRSLSECQQRRNRNIAKVRARVEHVFAAIEQMGDNLIRTIGQARANFAMTMMVVTYNIKRLTFLERVLIRAVIIALG